MSQISYRDIWSRIPEPPIWWLDGVPRYEPFKPVMMPLGSEEALLVHIQCQSCRHDFNVGVYKPHPWFEATLRKQLEDHDNIWPSDPPNIGCCGIGHSMSPLEIKVLEFWERDRSLPSPGWRRVPDLEKILEDGK